MLFILALSNDIPERKMILYFSVLPFIISILTSISVLGNKPIKYTIRYTKISLFVLILVISVVFVDVVILDGLFSKILEYGIKNSLPIDLNKMNKIADYMNELNRTNSK